MIDRFTPLHLIKRMLISQFDTNYLGRINHLLSKRLLDQYATRTLGLKGYLVLIKLLFVWARMSSQILHWLIEFTESFRVGSLQIQLIHFIWSRFKYYLFPATNYKITFGEVELLEHRKQSYQKLYWSQIFTWPRLCLELQTAITEFKSLTWLKHGPQTMRREHQSLGYPFNKVNVAVTAKTLEIARK